MSPAKKKKNANKVSVLPPFQICFYLCFLSLFLSFFFWFPLLCFRLLLATGKLLAVVLLSCLAGGAGG
jgi:hypothetical protein